MKQLQETFPSTQEANKVSAGVGTNCNRCGNGRQRTYRCLMILALCCNCGITAHFLAVC